MIFQTHVSYTAVYQNIKTPKVINIKFGMGNYVGDITPHVKNESDYPSGGITTMVYR